MAIHGQFFGARIRKRNILVNFQFYYTKVRCKGFKSQKHVMLMLKQMHGQVTHQCRHTRAFVSYFFDDACSILSSMSVSLF